MARAVRVVAGIAPLRLDSIFEGRATYIAVSARKFKPGDLVDFAMVGSGAAGGVMARELSAAGFTVVVLEQGPRFGPGDFEHMNSSTAIFPA